ncbi:MAG TPA: M28 family peptidase, partial [Gemmatimonadaceae bacterium]|nr:M28 family peptidase [Gemmatimonadaceae bacterium]
ARDGTVSLARRGGTVTTAWEGQTALLHFDQRAPLRGVIIPRESADTKRIRDLTAWFGLDSAQLVARGVRVGLGVTSYKRADRLAGTRITGRATDDRVGSAALIHALHGIDPTKLTRRAIFAWSVSEETGLTGARYIGTKHGASLKRVYSIDTFVSSDTPLERPMFAFTPLGDGVVMRGLDDGAMAPLEEMLRIERIARAHDIPLQVGTTHGSTDGTSLTVYGASNVGLSWPGRYSHSPGEVLDLRDMDALVRLVLAVALEP